MTPALTCSRKASGFETISFPEILQVHRKIASRRRKDLSDIPSSRSAGGCIGAGGRTGTSSSQKVVSTCQPLICCGQIK